MADVVWPLWRRIALRFGVIAGVLLFHPFPLGLIPFTETLARWVGAPWEALVLWFAESVLGTERPSTVPTGSGDTLFEFVSLLLVVIVAAIGTAVWSYVDRKRLAYPRLAASSLVVLRYVLATAMLGYGFAKIINTQFPAPMPVRLDGRIGDMSPMGLLWTFMGYSEPYTIFGGIAEAFAGVLLLFRRTTVAGALVAMAVMTNVVMLNYSYDVPVKLYSSQLLLMSFLIAAPHARRLIAAVLGRATAEVPEPPRLSERYERIRIGIKALVLACIAYSLYQQVQGAREYRSTRNELTEIWAVDTFSLDGIERAPLLTDEVRWRKLAFSPRGFALRTMPDDAPRIYGSYELDTSLRMLWIVDGEHTDIWSYQRPDADHLVIDGPFRGGYVHATLHREDDPLLITRGFHWIQEQPFNR